MQNVSHNDSPSIPPPPASRENTHARTNGATKMEDAPNRSRATETLPAKVLGMGCGDAMENLLEELASGTEIVRRWVVGRLCEDVTSVVANADIVLVTSLASKAEAARAAYERDRCEKTPIPFHPTPKAGPAISSSQGVGYLRDALADIVATVNTYAKLIPRDADYVACRGELDQHVGEAARALAEIEDDIVEAGGDKIAGRRPIRVAKAEDVPTSVPAAMEQIQDAEQHVNELIGIALAIANDDGGDDSDLVAINRLAGALRNNLRGALAELRPIEPSPNTKGAQ